MENHRNRILFVTYCEDIRQEVGNKYSLMGCFAGELQVPQFPMLMPKLCAYFQIATPKQRMFKRLTIRLTIGDDVVQSIEYPEENLLAMQKSISHDPGDVNLITISGGCELIALTAVEPCTIRISAETEDETLLGSRLRIVLSPQAMTAVAQII